MIPLLRGWTTVERTPKTNLRLGATLAFVAGATNAGGFLAVGQYTSHMTGMVSSIADNLVLGQIALVMAGLSAVLAFLGGAMTTVWMVNWALRRKLHSAYGRPLLVEAFLLLVFGLFGASIAHQDYLLVPLTVLILCYIMGLQNAVITKISHAEIRTTHMTGLLTDLGIELGKLLYVNRLDRTRPVRASRTRIRIQLTLVLCFLGGGVVGALGFKHLGYIATVPLAGLLVLLVVRPVLDDARNWIHPH